MSAETLIYSALKTLARVDRDVTPPTVIVLPRITFQQIGGRPINFLGGDIPSKSNARFQINVWHSSRDEAMALMRQAINALRGTTALHCTVLTGPVAIHEPGGQVDGTDLYGAMQDVSVWVDD